MMNTIFVGKVYRRFHTLPSTNEYASGLLAKSRPPEGTVVRAAIQTAGRGQYGSQWLSAPGENLTLSVIFYPEWLEPARQFGLSMAAALAVRDTVHGARSTADGPRPTRGTGPCTVHRAPCTVKWPNDVYLADRKVAGILIQNTLSAGRIASCIIGVGLNVNQTVFDPALPNPGSLAQDAGRPLDLDLVADRLLENLERRYLQLRDGSAEALAADYRAALYRLDQPSSFRRTADGSVFTGHIRGVTPEGHLRVDTGAGEEQFDLKEIRFL